MVQKSDAGKGRRKGRGHKCGDADNRATPREPAMRPRIGFRRLSGIDENAYAPAGKDQCGPREEDEVTQTLDGNDVRVERLRQPAPGQRLDDGGQKRRRGGCCREDDRPASGRRAKPPQQRCGGNRGPHHIQDVDLQQIQPAGGPSQKEGLKPEEERQRKDFESPQCDGSRGGVHVSRPAQLRSSR